MRLHVDVVGIGVVPRGLVTNRDADREVRRRSGREQCGLCIALAVVLLGVSARQSVNFQVPPASVMLASRAGGIAGPTAHWSAWVTETSGCARSSGLRYTRSGRGPV
jgi:hypothetical protein